MGGGYCEVATLPHRDPWEAGTRSDHPPGDAGDLLELWDCPEERGGEAMRLLLVEDNRPYGESMLRALEADGWDVTWCTTLESANAVMEDHEYDCAVLDWELPDGLGSQLIPRLQVLGIPCCVCSGLERPVPDGVPMFVKDAVAPLFGWIGSRAKEVKA
jgi:hypothetical protein